MKSDVFDLPRPPLEDPLFPTDETMQALHQQVFAVIAEGSQKQKKRLWLPLFGAGRAAAGIAAVCLLSVGGWMLHQHRAHRPEAKVARWVENASPQEAQLVQELEQNNLDALTL